MLCGFAAKNDYERTIYHHLAHTKQCLYDIGLVWASETSGERGQQPLATHRGHRILVGHRLLRILLPGASESARLRREWRTLQPHPAEGHSGVHLAGGVLYHCQHHVSGHTPALEPYIGVPAHYLRRLSGIHEVKSESRRVKSERRRVKSET